VDGFGSMKRRAAPDVLRPCGKRQDFHAAGFAIDGK
jgi:hypothetical protein